MASASWFMKFLHSQFFVTPPRSNKSFTNQTVIVTGANTGLGLAAARQITELNAAKVILAVRNISKGEAAKTLIETASHRVNIVEVWPLDLSSYESVNQFAARASTSLQRVDVLLENAGMRTFKFRVTEEDESTVTTNVVSTFLLALLMLPKMKETAQRYSTQPRITIVASDLHFMARLPTYDAGSIFEAFRKEGDANLSARYGQTKLLDILLVRHLAAVLAQTSPSSSSPIIVNTLSPGLCNTDTMKDEISPIVRFVAQPFMKILARTPEIGARTLVIAASSGEETMGEYMDDGKVALVSPFARSEEGQRAGQAVCKELLEKLERVVPGISGNLYLADENGPTTSVSAY